MRPSHTGALRMRGDERPPDGETERWMEDRHGNEARTLRERHTLLELDARIRPLPGAQAEPRYGISFAASGGNGIEKVIDGSDTAIATTEIGNELETWRRDREPSAEGRRDGQAPEWEVNGERTPELSTGLERALRALNTGARAELTVHHHGRLVARCEQIQKGHETHGTPLQIRMLFGRSERETTRAIDPAHPGATIRWLIRQLRTATMEGPTAENDNATVQPAEATGKSTPARLIVDALQSTEPMNVSLSWQDRNNDGYRLKVRRGPNGGPANLRVALECTGTLGNAAFEDAGRTITKRLWRTSRRISFDQEQPQGGPR